jgi:hypothetical protein
VPSHTVKKGTVSVDEWVYTEMTMLNIVQRRLPQLLNGKNNVELYLCEKNEWKK